MSDQPWRRTGTRTVFECPWLRVRQDDVTLPGGEAIQYHVVERQPWAMLVPILPDGRVVMERIYRWPVQRFTLECPSGGIDTDAPEDAARRELEEETGYRAGALVHLGRYHSSNGMTNERYDIFLSEEVEPGGNLRREITEEIEVELIPLAELRRRALACELGDGPTALAVLLASEHRASRAPC